MLKAVSILVSLVFFFVESPAFAESFDEKAQAMLDAQVAESGVVGLSAGIMHHGEILWLGGAGYRDREKGIPADGEMLHRIASITKSMTATAVMQLEESGKLKLDDKVRKHVKGYPKKDRGTPRVIHLLTHTSGTRHYRGAENRPMTHYATLDDALTLFVDRRLAFEPGARFLYTTYGYTLLGAVIEGASNQSYGEYMQVHVWGPAGMTRTGLEIRGKTAPEQSRLYHWDSDKNMVEDMYTDLSVKYPGGGVVSTAGDLLRFGQAFITGELVSPEAVARMLVVEEVDKQPVPYALGWMVFDAGELGRRIHNDGGQSGTSTTLDVYTEQDIVVAVLCNVYGAGQLTQGIAKRLVELVTEKLKRRGQTSCSASSIISSVVTFKRRRLRG